MMDSFSQLRIEIKVGKSQLTTKLAIPSGLVMTRDIESGMALAMASAAIKELNDRSAAAPKVSIDMGDL